MQVPEICHNKSSVKVVRDNTNGGNEANGSCMGSRIVGPLFICKNIDAWDHKITIV